GVAPKKGPVGPRDQFINFFRVEDGADPLEYQAGIPQALRLMNSPQTNANAAVIVEAAKGGSPERAIQHLYLATVPRRPNAQELPRMMQYVSGQSNPGTGYSDILWALLNSSEFALNH